MSNASMVRPDQDSGSGVGSIDDGQRRDGGRDTDRVLGVVVPQEHASERPKVAVLRGAYLSQFEMQTRASATWAWTMYSTESAIRSRLGRE